MTASSVVPTGKTEKLEYTIKKLMEVAKELQESKKAADESVSRSKKMGKRWVIYISTGWINSITQHIHPVLKTIVVNETLISLDS